MKDSTTRCRLRFRDRGRYAWILAAVIFLRGAQAWGEPGVHWIEATRIPWTHQKTGTVLEYNNKLWAVARAPYPEPSQFWSSPDGITWIQVADLPQGYGNPFVFKNRIHIAVRGSDKTRLLSTSDGKSWSTVSENFIGGYALVFNDKIYIRRENVLYRSDDGTSWTQVGGKLPVDTLRTVIFNVFQGKIWMMGAMEYYHNSPYTDIWCSTTGTTWTLATANAGWEPRYGFNSLVHDGKLWMVGGYDGEWHHYGYQDYFVTTRYFQDVWSSADGAQWTKVSDNTPIGEGVAPPVASFQNKFWLFDGTPSAIYYSWVPPGKPIVDRIMDRTFAEGAPYTGDTPALIQGTRPITWSLVNPPAGAKVDGQTGVVAWPFPLYGSEPYRVRLRAVNSLGTGETSWTLTVTPQPPPALSAPLFSKGNTCALSWTAVPNISGYHLQRAATADFSTILESANVSTTTLSRTFINLPDGKTFWYRIRGKKTGLLTSVWSSITSSTQDATAPKLWVGVDRRPTEWPLAATARFLLSAPDPGPLSSGDVQMRFSMDRKTWTPWRELTHRTSFWTGLSGGKLIFIQAADSVGNIREVSTTVTMAEINAYYVDGNNTTGPWTGRLERPYRYIQDAINAATDGRIIIVAPGTYRENIDLKNKNVMLRSADPQCEEIVKTTIIDGQYNDSVVTFGGWEDASCTLAGFTITGGDTRDDDGGGVRGNGTHAAILNNRIIGNTALQYHETVIESFTHYVDIFGYGGAIANCHGRIANNVIARNGVGIHPSYLGPSNISLADAVAGKPVYPPDEYHYSYSLHGAAIYHCNGTIVNNTIWGHQAERPCAAIEQCNGFIANNIIRNPGLTEISYCSMPRFCAITDALTSVGIGNIAADPRLRNPANGDFRLLPDSPCIDAGGKTEDLWDIDGDVRGYNSAGDRRGDGSDFDIGADEYAPREQAMWMLEPHGGEAMAAGALFRLEWLMDTARAGAKARLEVRRGTGAAVKAWSIDAPGGVGVDFKHLPDVNGTDFRLRAISESDPTIYTESPPFTIQQNSAVGAGMWEEYR